MRPPFRTPAWSAAACGRAGRSLGLKLNFSKRYITLAPIATVIGLAFRMFDPEHLLGDKVDIGITCALIPRDTPGIDDRPAPLPAQHPVPERTGARPRCVRAARLHHRRAGAMAGSGWRMLVEQLSVGRCISLPANATGGALAGVFATGAYARIRRQFNTPVGRFEGVEQTIARMVGLELHHGRRAQRDHRGHRQRREAGGAGRDPEIPPDRDGTARRQRRHGRARRQGHHARTAQLSGARLPVDPDRDHGRGRQHPHAQPDHLRTGRDPLPSVRAARDERGARSGSTRAAWRSSIARCSAISALRSPTRCARC